MFLTWRAEEHADRRRRRRHRDPEVGRLVDISVSGASVVAPAADDIGPGSVVLMQLGNARAAARIRRVESFDAEGWRIYGVEFVEVSPELLEWVNHLLDERRDRGLIHVWNREF